MITLSSYCDKIQVAETDDQLAELKGIIESQGYAFVNEWIMQMKKDIQHATEEQLDDIEQTLHKAAQVLPEPQKLSPLWEGLWSDLDFVYKTKKSLYHKIPKTEQTGEWQLLFNNPFSTDGVVIHADLSFAEATYQYAQYRKDLTKNEYISLQKVCRYITESGE
ncbi:hypothetical protein [Ammoniphilus sp. CFH 90114]|uniref:hypothetical protein n=1 Tax=Ammoniphilus sp. CFH 90114 TaxID=2493665 RepID=UPI00100FB08D|nr:hypothetical protein [Ammoniphilus sp. CFH 90114]RXT06260.1 hypothetical protein EIZ39_14320 [Ammoniphilus sp. CFH 90114]